MVVSTEIYYYARSRAEAFERDLLAAYPMINILAKNDFLISMLN